MNFLFNKNHHRKYIYFVIYIKDSPLSFTWNIIIIRKHQRGISTSNNKKESLGIQRFSFSLFLFPFLVVGFLQRCKSWGGEWHPLFLPLPLPLFLISMFSLLGCWCWCHFSQDSLSEWMSEMGALKYILLNSSLPSASHSHHLQRLMITVFLFLACN